jgi:hypothetical protein
MLLAKAGSSSTINIFMKELALDEPLMPGSAMAL